MPWSIPTQQSSLTGITKAKVTGWKETVSRFGNTPQVEFVFTTGKGARILLYMTITSAKQVETYLNAGILMPVREDEFDVVPIDRQPLVTIELKEGKLVKLTK